MDIRSEVAQYVAQGEQLLARLQTYEGDMLNELDVHRLRAQLNLIDMEATRLQKAIFSRPQKLLFEES
jgi:hypothetical protein